MFQENKLSFKEVWIHLRCTLHNSDGLAHSCAYLPDYLKSKNILQTNGLKRNYQLSLISRWFCYKKMVLLFGATSKNSCGPKGKKCTLR